MQYLYFFQHDVIYFNGLCLPDRQVRFLVDKIDKVCAQGTQIVSIGKPLSSFLLKKDRFEQIKTFKASFFWGKTEVILEKLK